MNCPKCGYDRVPEDARFCPNCSQPLEVASRFMIRPQAELRVEQQVEQNRGNVIGVQAQAIHGNVIGDKIEQVQIYVLSDESRHGSWRNFLKKDTPPYKFLKPYTASDRVLFKGRDDEIKQVVGRIGEQRLLVLYGQASVGKTSLLAAGVMPELMEYGALGVHIQDYLQPVEAIRDALVASAEQIPIALSAEATLPTLVRTVVEATQGSLVLAFDHFERFFEPAITDQQRTNLIEGLAEALEVVDPAFLRLLIAVRAEALEQVWKLQEHLPGLLHGAIQLLPLSRPQAQAAIEKPVAELDYPVSYVGNLVSERLLPDLDRLTPELAGIKPAQLQIVCHWLYQAARTRHPPHIDDRLYAELKGADGIMASYMDKALETWLAGERKLADRILVTLASPSIGRWVPPEQLPLNGVTAKEMYDVLEKLVEAELLVPRAVNGNREYTFASDNVKQNVIDKAGSEVRERYKAEEELERIWTAWLARNALATKGQLRYLVRNGAHLTPRSVVKDGAHPTPWTVKVLLLLHSAVVCGEPVGTWLAWLRIDEGRALIRQLEEPDGSAPSQYSSLTDLTHAKQLLGLPEEPLPDHPWNERDYGPVAWSAVKSLDADARQTAALALTVPYGKAALDRLSWALRAELRGQQRRERRAELLGALADADPEIEQLHADLSPLDQASIWYWRVRRRLFRDRHRLAALTIGGAIGAGLALGLLRTAVGVPASGRASPLFGIFFFFGAILGAALTLGMALANPLLLTNSAESGESLGEEHVQHRPHRLSVVLAVVLGMLCFGISHILVAVLNGVNLIKVPLLTGMAFVAGLGLSVALHDQPLAGWHLGVKQWLTRLGTAAFAFVLTQQVFIVLKGSPLAASTLATGWSGDTYKSQYINLVKKVWPQLLESESQWFHHLARLDAALVGIVLTIGITAGLLLASNWLARWRDLTNRASE